MPKDHPPTHAYAVSSLASFSSECFESACEARACGPCEIDGMWCADDDCYSELLSWPSYDTPRDQCTVERSEGNPELKHPWKMFAGFSSNYMVVYLTGTITPDSFTGRALRVPHTLERGYHLFGIRKDTEEEREERRACQRRVEQTVLDRENDRRGTDYTYQEVFDYWCQDAIDGCNSEGSSCFPEPPEVPSRLCDRPEEEREAYLEALEEKENEVSLELGCPLSEWWMTYIEDPSQQRIRVELTAESNPLFDYAREANADPL